MNTKMPPLPKSGYVLAVEAKPYEPEWITNEVGYTEEQMWEYAKAYSLYALLEALGINSPKMQQMTYKAVGLDTESEGELDGSTNSST